LLAHLDAAGLHRLADRLSRASIDGDSFCAVAALAFDSRLKSDHRLTLGDACAAIPPFTGNGMAMALQGAELALEPMVDYATNVRSWREASRATTNALRSRFRLRLASASALHPFLLRSQPQRWFALLSRAGLIPFRPLYASLH
jgi:2-polyprenyl-6-methoxyphenol hydroxylase-like FAD-dependent oxidoreductase